MSIIAGFSVPAASFALERALRENPDVTVEVERLATHSREWVMPFLWATDSDLDAFESSLADDPTVERFSRTDASDEMRLYNVLWSDEVTEMVDTIIDQRGILLEVEARGGRWYLKLRFREHDHLEAFQAYFRDTDSGFELRQLATDPGPKHRQFDLTQKQRESLVVAYEAGYFDVPQHATLAEVADRLGVSQSAASNRIHRGVGALVRNALIVTLPQGSDRARGSTAAERDGTER